MKSTRRRGGPGPKLATYAAKWVRPKVVVPVHYKTFPLLTDDISEFKPSGVEVREMQPGESWVYG